jgi:transposase
LPDGVPRTAFGPRLHAVLSVLTGAYRLSKRQVAQLCSDLLSLTISIGMIAKRERITAEVLERSVTELAEQVKTAEAANLDETGGRASGRKAWLWVVVTSLGIVFRIVRSRAGAVAKDLLGEQPKPIVISDRFPGYEWIELKSRQICWAHLRSDFQAMIDREGEGAEVGRQLLGQSNKRFEAWHKARDGIIRRSTFLQTVAWLRPMVRRSLERGSGCACTKTAATCGELLRLWECLWTFTRVEGVEPTNNAAERALRHAVIWRRISGGTDSEGGSRFVERMLSVLATCRQQERSVLAYLWHCPQARLDRLPPPSLLSAAHLAGAAAGPMVALRHDPRHQWVQLSDEGTTNGPLHRHQWLLLQAMEGHVLSREPAGSADAPILRRAVLYGRDQQHVLWYAQGIDLGRMGRRGPRRFPVRAQGAEADHACAEARRCG